MHAPDLLPATTRPPPMTQFEAACAAVFTTTASSRSSRGTGDGVACLGISKLAMLRALSSSGGPLAETWRRGSSSRRRGPRVSSSLSSPRQRAKIKTKNMQVPGERRPGRARDRRRELPLMSCAKPLLRNSDVHSNAKQLLRLSLPTPPAHLFDLAHRPRAFFVAAVSAAPSALFHQQRDKRTRSRGALVATPFVPPKPPSPSLRDSTATLPPTLTMAVDFSTDSPLASALQSIVQPKLAEFGWTTGGDDTTIFEYILLMLANDKNEAQIASELSNDLLDLGPENPETQQFAHWLFEQISSLRRQLGGADDGGASDNQMDMNNASTSAQDTEMEGAADSSQGNIPTGPKAMRNGSSSKPVRGGRMLNQLNKQMNRPDDSALHRVRGSQGTGRINSHGREPPKGPRGQNIGRGIDAMANGRGMGNVGNINMGPSGMNGMNGMGGGIPGMQMPGGMNQNAGMMLNPQQQMALMQMYEQQAQMMQQILTGQNPAPYVNPNFHQRKKPFNDRSRQASKQGMTPSTKFVKKEGQDEAMADGTAAESGEGMDVENSRPDPFSTMCKFNLRCGKPDCHFAHQSPAAPEGTPVDMKDTCTYGVACANHKCVGRHPSPAQRQKYQSEQECAFYPNCRDPANCPYKHPSAPPCRNGPDCTTPGCKFWHSSVPCKYNPCTNLRCPYKHVEGQKKAAHSNVWVAPKNGEEQKKDHVSERKFVEEGAEEELIIPGKTGEDTDVQL